MLAVCWLYLGPHIVGRLFPSKKKGTQAFGSYLRVFFDFHPPCHVFSAEMHLPTFRARSVRNATLKAIAFYLVRMAGDSNNHFTQSL